jgi:hypothetical protein
MTTGTVSDSVALGTYRITLPDFTLSFVPFALLLSAALLAPETTMDLGFYRTVYTIWATTALVTPALCAFMLPGDSQSKQSIWILFWTFAFIAYLVHVYYAIFYVYHGSLHEILAGQGRFAALNNLIFTVWWAFDLLLAWFYSGSAKWVWNQRVAAHVYIGLTFFASTVILKRGFINVIGIAMTVAIFICLAYRSDYAKRSAFSH